jgi:biotin carboxylase
VVVVDPYSTGRFYLYDLKARGINIICVRSSSVGVDPLYTKVFEAHRDYYCEVRDADKFASVDDLIKELRSLPYQICAVIPGSDAGVILGEELSERMNMATANGTERLKQRTDKASMQDRLRECGIAACEQIKSGDLDELLQWARARGDWPLVAKPTGGMGSDGVFFCQNEEDLCRAHGAIIGQLNPKGQKNEFVALQEFLKGDEYIVDTVSKNGKHICVAMWSQGKRRNLPWNPTGVITTENHLLPPSGEVEDQLVNYVFSVLDAFDYKHGPCHTEVMLTPRGPVLIETNCRMHGVQGPVTMELGTGVNKAAHSLDIFLDSGKEFDGRYRPGAQRWLYPVVKHAAMVVLCSPVEGELVQSVPELIHELKLSSTVEVVSGCKAGAWVRQSSDLQTSPGTVIMANVSNEALLADIEKLRAAESLGSAAGGIYRVKQARTAAAAAAGA